jgi:spoIIIJ-associated protein
MNGYKTTGKTVDDAVEKALHELGIKKNNARIIILDEPSLGILGLLGNKEAKVEVSALLDPVEYLSEYIKELLSLMKVQGTVDVIEDDEKLSASIEGSDVGILIGRRGRTLGDLQYVLNVIMRRQFAMLNKMIVIDVENYRLRREKTLIQLAKNVARKVSQEGFEQALEPMNPQERRIIHLALQEFPGITTYSSGQEPYRKVIVAPR